MNWLDIIFILIDIIIVVVMILMIEVGIEEADGELVLAIIIVGFMFLLLTFFAPFVVLDRSSGSTIGEITSVDKNFFGTTSIYIKTSETEQEEYCIEFNKDLEKQANELIGKRVKVSYGKRVGIYSTGDCHSSPINKIEITE